MFYVGLDIHSKYICVCILNDNGKIVQRLKVRQVDQMINVLEELSDRFASATRPVAVTGTITNCSRRWPRECPSRIRDC